MYPSQFANRISPVRGPSDAGGASLPGTGVGASPEGEGAAAEAPGDADGPTPPPEVLARNAANPTAPSATAPPITNLRRDTPLGGTGAPSPSAAATAAPTGPAGGGEPVTSTAKVWSGDQVNWTSSPGSQSSARVARSTFCS